MSDIYNLQRFVDAQNPVYAEVTAELRAGAKRSHWMWFIFPQIAGLGGSAMARRFAIASADEARAYLSHPILGPRLEECARLACLVEGRSARALFGAPDDLKFHSSMTLFAAVEADAIFREALAKYFEGRADSATLERLARPAGVKP
jgi:uncharacterized protein (DUF1810 family)